MYIYIYILIITRQMRTVCGAPRRGSVEEGVSLLESSLGARR